MAQEYAIALVAQNKLAREALAAQLMREGDLALSLFEDYANIEADSFDLLVIDEAEPVEASFLQNLKKPILVLQQKDTSQNNAYSRSERLQKPFRLQALLTQIHALLRQFEASDEAVYVLGAYQFFPGQKLLRDALTQEIKLTDKETAIIRYLLRYPHEAVARETLLTQVWGYHSAVTTHTLETHIYRLRQKIEKGNLLITEPGGYRLNLEAKAT